MIRIVVAIALVLAARAAWAEGDAKDAVALLPLDAERSLELYGQPVASEIARALVAGSVRVVVVGPRTAMPEHARLIVDGTIGNGKAGAIAISLRVRSTIDGKVLDTLSVSAPGLAKLDGAAAELSAKLLPIVRDRLAALRARDDDHGRVVQVRPEKPAPVAKTAGPLLIALDAPGAAKVAPLSSALDAELTTWTRAHHRARQKLDAAQLGPAAVASASADLALAFSILDYEVDVATPTSPMLARARVRVRIASAREIAFERVVFTDTVVGDMGITREALAARTARELLAILRPHLRRLVASWD